MYAARRAIAWMLCVIAVTGCLEDDSEAPAELDQGRAADGALDLSVALDAGEHDSAALDPDTLDPDRDTLDPDTLGPDTLDSGPPDLRDARVADARPDLQPLPDVRVEDAAVACEAGGAPCAARTEVCSAEGVCERRGCEADVDCPAGSFCDREASLCAQWCDADAQCPGGEVCLERECLDISDCICPGGDVARCDEPCPQGCESDEDCLLGEYCSMESGECVAGCRDDQPNPDDVDSAYAIELPQRFDERGVKSAVVEGRQFCDDRSDFFRIELSQGERFLVELEYSEQLLENVNMRLVGEPVEVVGLENIKRIAWPPIGEVRPATTYYLEVFGDVAEELGVEYRLRVFVVDVEGFLCRPDERDPGDDGPERATPVVEPVEEFQGIRCVDDEDWFAVRLEAGERLWASISGFWVEPPPTLSVYDTAGQEEPGWLANPLAQAERDENGRYVVEWGGAGATDLLIRVSGPSESHYLAHFRRLGALECVEEVPNESEAEAVDLSDPRYGVVDDGVVPPDEDSPVDLEGRVCGDDIDVYCFPVEVGDRVQAWIEWQGEAPRVEFTVDDAPVGRRGERAEWRALRERACVRVAGGDADYQLFVRRSPGPSVCGPEPDAAVPLVVDDDAVALCAAEGWHALDWGAVEAADRTCVMLTASAPVNWALLQAEGACGDCEQCVGEQCVEPLWSAEGVVADARLVRDARPEWVQVTPADPDADGVAYGLSTVRMPSVAAEACPPDPYEPNSDRHTPTWLGDKPQARCDAWICAEHEGNILSGDWFQIEVPPGEDRTVFIGYDPLPVEGRLVLDVYDPDIGGVADPFAGIRSSQHPIVGAQCINIEGGATARFVSVAVMLDQVSLHDPDRRVHYTLQVQPTDLERSPTGECVRLAAIDLPACPGRELGRDCWPVLDAE